MIFNKWKKIKDNDMSNWVDDKITSIYLEKDNPFYKGKMEEQRIFNGKKYKYKADFAYAGHGNWDIQVYKKRRNKK